MAYISVEPLSRRAIQARADTVRKVFGVDEMYFPVVQLIEGLGQMEDEDGNVLLNSEIVSDAEMPGEYATYSPASNTIRMRESVYCGACDDSGRDRFTLAHELGHFFLHRNQQPQYARFSSEVPAFQDPEWQANTFASMLLIPRDKIQGMRAEKIAIQCAVSKQAADIALQR